MTTMMTRTWPSNMAPKIAPKTASNVAPNVAPLQQPAIGSQIQLPMLLPILLRCSSHIVVVILVIMAPKCNSVAAVIF